MAFARPDKEYKVFQFPRTAIPRIDGDFSDWEIVPDSYSVGLSELYDTHGGRGARLDPREFDLTVKVGWVAGENRLYFYVEAYDDCWDFADEGLRQDIFELVVDADLSGGPFIKEDNGNRNKLPVSDLHFKGHGAHAQNYHIFTPVQPGKDWAMVWGSTPWIKDFPYANVAYDYDFAQGESGTLRMEFWITPFDYAAVEGISRSVVSRLEENELIGLSWCMIDFDTDKPQADPVMCLSHDFRMIRDGSFLNAFPAPAAGRFAVSRDRGRLVFRGNRPRPKAYPFRGPFTRKDREAALEFRRRDRSRRILPRSPLSEGRRMDRYLVCRGPRRLGSKDQSLGSRYQVAGFYDGYDHAVIRLPTEFFRTRPG